MWVTNNPQGHECVILTVCSGVIIIGRYWPKNYEYHISVKFSQIWHLFCQYYTNQEPMGSCTNCRLTMIKWVCSHALLSSLTKVFNQKLGGFLHVMTLWNKQWCCTSKLTVRWSMQVDKWGTMRLWDYMRWRWVLFHSLRATFQVVLLHTF